MISSDSDPGGALVEPLTRREQEVLRLLADGCSRPEIAERLTVTLSSVKFHIQNIYGKLGANSKRQALARAGELGLLAQPATPQAPPPEPRPGPLPGLPLQLTSFIGREKEIAAVRRLVSQARLVTLTGAGGSGKTRLALEAAGGLLDEYSDGVWLVELAPLADAWLVPQSVAAALGLREIPGRAVTELLLEYLRPKQLLLVLDNCEHLVQACAELAERLLRACAQLTILATSREALNIAGETPFLVPTLASPTEYDLTSLEALGGYEAVRLFVDRAQAGQPGFQLASSNARAVGQVCHQLDGIPLAIELAAARLKVLSLDEIASGLDNRFQLLRGGSRTALPRHQTLQALIDWSYDLLSEPERALLRRLAVFAGGCTLEAARAVCSDEGLQASEMLDCLTALVDKSLVNAERRPGQDTRYYLLEMVRQYAWEKLAVGGAQERTQCRHRDYFLSFAEKHAPDLNQAEFLSRQRAIDTDLANIRRALDWSFSNRTSIAAGVRLVLVATHQLYSLAEKLDWCTRAIALAESEPNIPDDLLVELLLLARAYVVVDDPLAALALTERALEISRGLGRERPVLQLDSLCHLAEFYVALLDDAERGQATLAEARKLFESSESDLRSPSKEGWQAWFCRLEFQFAFSRGDFLGAEAWAVESIRREMELGSPWGIMRAQRDMGSACLSLGKHAEARRHFLLALDIEESLSITGSWQSLTGSLIRLVGEVDLRQGELAQAWQHCQRSLRLAANAFERNVMASGLGLAAAIAAKQGRRARAARLSGASKALYARQSRKPWEDSSLDTLLPGWETGPGQAALSAAFEDGQTLSADQAIALALDEKSSP